MADFKDFLSTDGYLARLTRLNEIKTALAQWLSVGSHSNVPEGAIRWSKAQKRFEVYTGGTWGALEAEYNINVKKLQDAEPKAEVSNNSIVKRTNAGQIKAANPAANDDVTTRGASDARYLRQDDLGKTGGVTVQFAAHADQADQAGHAQTAGHASTAGSATSAGYAATAGDATSVGGITPGQIARLDRNADFGGAVGARRQLYVKQNQGSDNLHYWFRDAADRAIGVLYRNGTTGAMVIRRYKEANGAFEDAQLLPGGIFEAPAFRGDGSRLTGLPFGEGWFLYNMDSSRSMNTVYQNTTGYPMTVSIRRASDTGSAYLDVGPSPDSLIVSGVSSRWSTCTAIVPPGFYYRNSSDSVSIWRELRKGGL